MSRVFFDSELDTAAAWWRIYRRDGVALGFTTHNRDLRFGGMLHRAAPGMLPSAIRRSAGFDDDEAEVEGALAHDTIREGDLAAGRFDGAQIEMGVVDWQNLEAESLYTGSIDSVTQDAGGFAAHLRSAKAQLDVDPIPRASPNCRARFCGPGCGLPPTRFTRRSVVTAVDLGANGLRVALPDASPFAQGELRLIDGPQTGQMFHILAVENGLLLLDRLLDEGTVAGHRVMLRQGCDKTIATCASRFGNAANFQGEPFLPGNDLLTHYPQPR